VHSYYTIVLAFTLANASLFGGCEPALEVRADLTMTADYQATLSDSEVGAGDRTKTIFAKNDKIFISTDLQLVREKTKRCEYQTRNLELTANGYSWAPQASYRSRINLRRGQWVRFILSGLRPTKNFEIQSSTTGQKIIRTYYGNRPLYLSGVPNGMDDTSVVLKGLLAYVDYGAGHEVFGRGTILISQD